MPDLLPLTDTAPDVRSWIRRAARAVNEVWAITKQPLDADLAEVAASGISGAWTIYTPSLSAPGGFTSASATGRYMKVGKIVHFSILVTITTNGAANSYFVVTLPFNAVNGGASYYQPFAAKDISNGFLGNAAVGPNDNAVVVQRYDGAYLGGNGVKVVLSGTYESA